VTVVADAEAALSALAAAAKDAPFEIAIVDHTMPGIGGEELGRRIRAEARYDGLKMVLSSSSGLVLSHRNAHALGFQAALSKPLHRTVVLNCLGYLYDVNLPRAGAEAPVALAPASGRRTLRILVAEDNKVNQLLLDTMLRGAGHEVDVANDGQEAVAAVHENTYDVVLMDMHMPKLNGLEATRRIRQMPGVSATVPVIAITAAVMRNDREKCHQAGMNDFVSKPIDQHQLFEKMAFWTNSEISGPADKPEKSPGDADPGLSEDAAAALDDLLGTIEDVAEETSLIRDSNRG
jgi:two-component system, sensor histidine kinase and response regulator